MEYQTAFDLTIAGYKNWSVTVDGLIFIAIGAGVVLNRKRLPGWWRNHPRASNSFAFFFFGFAAFWTLGASVETYSQYASLVKAARANQLQKAEGVVTAFRPMPASGHPMERFCVAQACFEYSDYAITAGFNNTSSNGGPIRDGLPVRVTYVGNTIVKLEVAK